LQQPANIDKSKGDSSNFEFVGQAVFEDSNVERDQDRWKWRAGKMAMTRQRLTNMFDGGWRMDMGG